MAEPASTSPPAAGGAERDVLLATKLHLPRPRPGFLSRQRLLERLAEGAARELTLVCAPAGFGKTSLLGDWARRGQPAVAWLSLDAGDNDPARFWRYVAAALDSAGAGVAERAAPVLQAAQPASLEAVVTVVVNALAGLPDQVALVLDDYHLIETPPVHHSLGMLLERQPAQLRLVVAGRADPPLPLARLRARGQLAELRQGDLRFTAEETAVLLEKVMGLELPTGSLAALAARTEGWAAGLQLAGLSLRDHADPAGFVASFSGSQRHILDYLTEEVLARQPEELVRFLLETSVLERLSGPLCDAVTGRTGSQQLLEQVERANLFLIPLDEVRGWWRYHQLFADLLQTRLRQAQPDRVPELHRAAAAWYEQHGLADDAVRHALAAGDATSAARLVERYVDELWVRGERETLHRWLAVLPAELVGARPRLLLTRAGLAILSGDLEAGEEALDAAERAFAAAAGEAKEPYEPSVGRAASLLANIPARIALERAWLAGLGGDAEGTTAFVERAQAEVGEDEWMLAAFTRWEQGRGGWLRGQLAEAERAFLSCVDGWSAAGEVSLAAWAGDHLGQLQRAQGRLDAALGPTGGRWSSPRRQAGRPCPPRASPRWHGRGGLPAGRAPRHPAIPHRWHRPEPPAHLHPDAGHGAGDPGLDPAGRRRCRRCSGRHRGGWAGRAEPDPGRLGQPGSGAAGAAAAGPGRPRRGHPAALATLAEALRLGATEGYLRVFVDEGQPMATLVGKLLAIRHGQPTVADTIPRDYLSRLVAAFEGPGWRRGLPPGAAR